MDALIRAESSTLLLVDLQSGLAPHVHAGEEVVSSCANLLAGARLLEVPVVVSEHYPKGLGRTVSALAEQIHDEEVFAKNHFSCMSDPDLRARLIAGKRSMLIIAGMEAHVCVMQTALEARACGLTVVVVADAVGSRRESDRDLALDRMARAGIMLVSREMLLFEWCGRGDSEIFRALLARCLR